MSEMKGKIFVDVWNADQKPLDAMAALAFVTGEGEQVRNGAESLFVGTVRNHNLGKPVLGISYDVFEPLAKQSFLEVCQEAQAKWGADLDFYVVHAQGRLNIGDLAIVIAVGSPHRDEAFKACRFVIEEVKHRSPVWKLEHYEDGDSEWSKGCELCSSSHRHESHGV